MVKRHSTLALVLGVICSAILAPATQAIEIQPPFIGDQTLTITGITIPEPVGTPPRAQTSAVTGSPPRAYDLGRIIGYYLSVGAGAQVLLQDIALSPEATQEVVNLTNSVSVGDFCVLLDVLNGALAVLQVVSAPKDLATGALAESLTIEGFTEGATQYVVRGLPAGATLRARYVAPGGREVTYQLTEGAYPDLDGEANGEVVLQSLRVGGPPYVLAGDTLILVAVGTTEVYAGAWNAEGLGVRYTVPVASHIIGATGAPFISDLSIANPFGLDANGWLRFVQEGTAWQSAPEVAFSLAPGESMSWEDVLQSAFGITANVKGTLLVGGTPLWQLAVSSRNYAVDAEGRRFGIAIPGIPSLEPVSTLDTWVLPNLRESGDFRTNLIIAGATPEPSTVSLRLISNGEVVATADQEVPGYGLLQLNRVAITLGAGEVENGYVDLVVTSGGVYPALSVVDGSADDAAFVQGGPMLGGS